MDSTQLSHYGVLGMKWGVRRARKLENKISKSRKMTSKWDKALRDQEKKTGEDLSSYRKENRVEGQLVEKRYRSKIEKIRKKESNFGGSAARIKKMSTGKALASSMLMGTYGSLKYQQARASGAKRGEAYLSAIGPRFIDNVTMGLYSTYESRKKN